MLSPGKYVVDLEHYGRRFSNHIKEYNYGYSPTKTEFQINEDHRFIYTETTNQIMLVFHPDPRIFFQQLNNLPNLDYFRHIAEIWDPQRLEIFRRAMVEYATGVYFQLGQKLGLNPNYEYLLEAVAIDYIVVCVYVKPQEPI